jgi:hypothetical protein
MRRRAAETGQLLGQLFRAVENRRATAHAVESTLRGVYSYPA